jgi:hypothetical protein
MTTLADDLLRSRTIPELRELVNSLERDSGAKRTELQHMVGSKYHDFIQSADKISSMKDKSVALEQQITSFYAANEKLLAQASTILDFSQPDLQRQKPQQSNHATAGAHLERHTVANILLIIFYFAFAAELTCAAVWDDLNNCDVFGATKALLMSSLLAHDPNESKSSGSALRTHFGEQSGQVLRDAGNRLPPKVLREMKSICFLHDTVVDDIHLLLLTDDAAEGSKSATSGDGSIAGLGIVQKAKALAALSVTQAAIVADAPTTAGGDSGSQCGVRRLLQTYLSSAAVLVQDILETQLNVSAKGKHVILREGMNGAVQTRARIMCLQTPRKSTRCERASSRS